MNEMFGEEPGGYDDYDDYDDIGDESPPGDIGEGSWFEIDEDEWKALMHHPLVLYAIGVRGVELAEIANSMVALDPRAVDRLSKQDQGAPAYIASLQNQTDTTRVRVRVRAGGLQGLVDDAANSTLMKLLNISQSDPIPTPEEVEGWVANPPPTGALSVAGLRGDPIGDL